MFHLPMRQNFWLNGILSARREDRFFKLSKTDPPFRCCKIGSRNTYNSFLAEKWSFVLFVILCHFRLTFLILSACRAEKNAFKEKIIRCKAWELLNP